MKYYQIGYCPKRCNEHVDVNDIKEKVGNRFLAAVDTRIVLISYSWIPHWHTTKATASSISAHRPIDSAECVCCLVY